jgi:hypothetical protein
MYGFRGLADDLPRINISEVRSANGNFDHTRVSCAHPVEIEMEIKRCAPRRRRRRRIYSYSMIL